MERLKAEKGADWVRVPFRGGGEAVTAIMNGSTPIGLIGIGNVLGHLSAGDMTALVMLNNIRFPQYPNIPTLEETDYQRPRLGELVRACSCRPARRKPIIDKLAAEIAKIVDDPGLPRKRPSSARGPRANDRRPPRIRRRDREGAPPIARQVVKKTPACSRNGLK